MMSDFGVRGSLLLWISFESELMANGGISLHGTSVFEGQASLQVRKQVIHLGKGWWMLEARRVVDEASVDYFSNHIADTFLMDPATEPFLLFDGFNLGNGVRTTAEVLPGQRARRDIANRCTAIGIGGGLDLNYQKKFGDYNGVGAQIVQDESRVGPNGIISRNRYYNVGTTYWIAPMMALGLRYAEYTNEQLNQPASPTPTPSTGTRTVLFTLRLVL